MSKLHNPDNGPARDVTPGPNEFRKRPSNHGNLDDDPPTPKAYEPYKNTAVATPRRNDPPDRDKTWRNW